MHGLSWSLALQSSEGDQQGLKNRNPDKSIPDNSEELTAKQSDLQIRPDSTLKP